MSADDCTKPHPRWKPNDGSDRHPQTVEEWDSRNDPVGGAFERSLRRLNVAGDYDDPRAPDEMALVLRIDLIRLKHDWHHKNAVFEIWREERRLRQDPEIEAAAKAIYEKMPYDGPPGTTKPAWVPFGNSLKQDEARRIAHAESANVNSKEG